MFFFLQFCACFFVFVEDFFYLRLCTVLFFPAVTCSFLLTVLSIFFFAFLNFFSHCSFFTCPCPCFALPPPPLRTWWRRTFLGQPPGAAGINFLGQWVVTLPLAAAAAFVWGWGVPGLFGALLCGSALLPLLDGLVLGCMDWSRAGPSLSAGPQHTASVHVKKFCCSFCDLMPFFLIVFSPKKMHKIIRNENEHLLNQVHQLRVRVQTRLRVFFLCSFVLISSHTAVDGATGGRAMVHVQLPQWRKREPPTSDLQRVATPKQSFFCKHPPTLPNKDVAWKEGTLPPANPFPAQNPPLLHPWEKI